MARNKAAKKQEMRLVPHRSPNLSMLFERAQRSDSAQTVRAYLDAGGSPTALVDLQIGDQLLQLPLLLAIVFLNKHPHTHLAECLEHLIAAGADIDQVTILSGNREYTALMFAAERNCCVHLLHVLLQHGADPNHSSASGVTALHRAAAPGFSDMCEALLAAGSELDKQDIIGRTALARAAHYGHLELLRALHAHGADINKVDSEGRSPLLMAAIGGSVAVIEYLLSYGADLNARTDSGAIPLNAALEANSFAAAKLLLEHGADVASADRYTSALSTAACNGSVEMLELLAGSGLQDRFSDTDAAGNTLLLIAANYGRVSAAEWLIQKGLAVDACNSDGETALISATQQQYATVVEMLLANGCDVDKCDALERTALDHASMSGDMQCVKLLVEAGADVTQADSAGMSCLHRAVYSKHTDVVRLLIEHGAAAVIHRRSASVCGCCCARDACALMWSCDSAVTKLLLAAGADVHAANSKGSTCLHVAAAHGYPASVLCLLIKTGADLHAVNNEGKTAATVAHDSGNELIAALLNRAAREYQQY
jgi:ankyrin repeat protein